MIKYKLLLAFSAILYAYIMPIYFVLLIFSSAIDYQICKVLKQKKSKPHLYLSLFINLLPLLSFKFYGYYNSSLSLANQGAELIIPLGISFYTFKSISVVVDTYKYKTGIPGSYFNFLLYLLYFPTLLAGPIYKYSYFIEQLNSKYSKSNIRIGLERIIIGLGKKLVLLPWINLLYLGIENEISSLSIFDLIIFILGKSFYLYVDFSAYSDLAIGTSQIFGIKIPENFKLSLLATNFRDYWKRQHITMTNWFYEYVFMNSIQMVPFRKKAIRILSSVVITYLLSGLWHGLYYGAIVFSLILILGELLLYLLAKIKSKIFGWIIVQIFTSAAIMCLITQSETIILAFTNFTYDFTILSHSISMLTLYVCFISGQYIFDKLNKNNFKTTYFKALSYSTIFIMVIFYWGKDYNFIYANF